MQIPATALELQATAPTGTVNLEAAIQAFTAEAKTLRECGRHYAERNDNGSADWYWQRAAGLDVARELLTALHAGQPTANQPAPAPAA